MANDEIVQFKLLLPASLKARVEAAALQTRRSMSQEIVVALEEKFPAPKPPETPEAILGAEALLSLANADSRERRELILILNDKLGQADSVYRLELRREKVRIVEIGDQWSPEMALD